MNNLTLAAAEDRHGSSAATFSQCLPSRSTAAERAASSATVYSLEVEHWLSCAATTARPFGIEQLAEGKGRYAAGGLVAAAHASYGSAKRLGVRDGDWLPRLQAHA